MQPVQSPKNLRTTDLERSATPAAWHDTHRHEEGGEQRAKAPLSFDRKQHQASKMEGARAGHAVAFDDKLC